VSDRGVALILADLLHASIFDGRIARREGCKCDRLGKIANARFGLVPLKLYTVIFYLNYFSFFFKFYFSKILLILVCSRSANNFRVIFLLVHENQ